MNLPPKEKGFTLIELLIAIVIIGVLAGVLIAIINPTAQRNKAADAGVKAAMNKVALATEGYVSSYGTIPDEVQFLAALQNVTEFGTSCSTDGANDCLFTVSGNSLPATCGANNWGGAGTNQCQYRYTGVAGTTQFDVYAKSYGITNVVFLYDNTVGDIQHCDITGSTCIIP